MGVYKSTSVCEEGGGGGGMKLKLSHCEPATDLIDLPSSLFP